MQDLNSDSKVAQPQGLRLQKSLRRCARWCLAGSSALHVAKFICRQQQLPLHAITVAKRAGLKSNRSDKIHIPGQPLKAALPSTTSDSNAVPSFQRMTNVLVWQFQAAQPALGQSSGELPRAREWFGTGVQLDTALARARHAQRTEQAASCTVDIGEDRNCVPSGLMYASRHCRVVTDKCESSPKSCHWRLGLPMSASTAALRRLCSRESASRRLAFCSWACQNRQRPM